MIRVKGAKALVLSLCLAALAGCSPVYRNHGYVPVEEDLATLSVGQSTRQDVATAVGRPSATGLLQGSGWYYVGSRWKHFGPFAPEEISREVVAISFAENDTVSNIERFGLADGRVVPLSRRVTTDNVGGMSVIAQLLGNLGRLNPGQMLGSGNSSDPFARN